MRTFLRWVALPLLCLVVQSAPAFACGATGERLCNFFDDGRGGCDRGLVDVLGRCQAPRICGAEGQRLCFVFIDGRGGCDTDLVDTNGTCAMPNCGSDGQRACAIFGRNSCNTGLVEMNDTCFVRADCGAEGQRACLIGERVGNSCNADLIEQAGRCVATECGKLGTSACAVLGRNSCDEGLVDVKGTCKVRGACGGQWERYCEVGERDGDNCDASLVERRGQCVPCGMANERACAIVGRKSCDGGLVEFNDACRSIGDCGQAGQRACLIGERDGNSCDAGLFERSGKCLGCGALGQLACAIVGRKTCDEGLVEVNDICHTQNACGSAGERACMIGEREGKSCDEGLFEDAGMCHRCGASGQRACAIVGRKSCDAGLVEVNNTCFNRADCGASGQRACMVGEREAPSCDKGLVEANGLCAARGGGDGTPAAREVFVYVRTDPPLPVVRPGEPVYIVASPLDAVTKAPLKADRITILQASYVGTDSSAPVFVETCSDDVVCKFEVPKSKSPAAISYMARATVNGIVFESSIRITDLQFVAAPMRMNVAAEVTGKDVITEMPHSRAIDVVYYAGTGYEFQTTRGAQLFSTRLDGELDTMLGVAHSRPSSLADNLDAVSFFVAVAPATLNPYNGADMCEHSTAGPVPWGNAQGILHQDPTCRDWSVPGPFYSAETAAVSWHELHHAAFGLSDEYCVGTIHHNFSLTPNVYRDAGECARNASSPTACKRISEAEDCVGSQCTCTTNFWRSDPLNDDVMNTSYGREQADDLRSTTRKFAECRLGRC